MGDLTLTVETTLTDEDLARQTLNEPEAYGELIRRYEKRLNRYVSRISGLGSDEAADITQETFIRVYRNLRGFNPRLQFSPWIYRIAHNCAMSHMRRARLRKVISERFLPHPDFLSMIPDSVDLENKVSQKIFAARLRAILDTLDTKYRQVLVLRYVENLPYEEIARIVKKPVGTVSTLIRRGKESLRGKLIISDLAPVVA